MTVDASDSSAVRGLSEDDAKASTALRGQGLQCLRAGDLAQAIDLLSRAAAQDPDDPRTQLGLGIALQGMRRHAEALASLEGAQKSLTKDPLPFLHASLSQLALGKAEAALEAASEACARAPQLPQAHSAHGQALMALNEPARAEQAFAAALRRAPQWADVWVLCGAARYRQGAIEGAKAAMREALRHAPDHAAAKDNLAALLRIGVDELAAVSATPGGSDLFRRRRTRGEGRRHPQGVETEKPRGLPGPGGRVSQQEAGLRQTSIRRMVAGALLSGHPRPLFLCCRS